MGEGHNKKISLTVNQETLTELYKLIGRQQFIRGERITITEYISNVLSEYVNSQKSSKEEEVACATLKN